MARSAGRKGAPDAQPTDSTKRRHQPSQTYSAVRCGVKLLLIVIALIGTGTHVSSYPKKPGTSNLPPSHHSNVLASNGALVETVGGVTVQVGPRLEADHNTSADVHKASTDGQTDNAVYKKIRGGAPFGRHEVAATRAAGQLISAEGNRMIQHKVGEMGLNEYLKQASVDATAKTAYQRVNVIPATTTGKPKPKMSDHIYNQVLAHQRKTGYNHNDVHADNIRVTPQKQSAGTPYKGAKAELIDWGSAEKRKGIAAAVSCLTCGLVDPKRQAMIDKVQIKRACANNGFRFRNDIVGQLYRRAPTSCSKSALSAKLSTMAPKSNVKMKRVAAKAQSKSAGRTMGSGSAQ